MYHHFKKRISHRRRYAMKEMLEEKLARCVELEKQMEDPAVQADSYQMSKVAREHGSISRLVNKYRKFKSILQQIDELREMGKSDDAEEKELAEMEIPDMLEQREGLWNELLDQTVGGEDADRARCVMEIRAGAGGDEAGLFAGDLYQMYKKHAERKNWKCEVLEASPTEIGGFKEITLAFSGEGVFKELQYESGGHRVQRVPETETKGRIHTSAATVAVLPEPEDIEIDLKPDDYRKDLFCASGPGGQHVNKTTSAVRLTHLESGIVVSIQDEKSQHKNLAKAERILKARLYEAKVQEEQAKRADQRKGLVGSGDRSQRIRTYNFPENRVTDHRIGFRANLDAVLGGDVNVLTQAILDHERNELRDSMGGLDD